MPSTRSRLVGGRDQQIPSAQALEKIGDDTDRAVDIIGLGVAGGFARSKIVVAIRKPVESNVRSQRVAIDFQARTEGIAFTLTDQGGQDELLEMRGAQPIWFSGRMERIAEAHEPGKVLRSSDHACYPPPERLSTDYDLRARTGVLHGLIDDNSKCID